MSILEIIGGILLLVVIGLGIIIKKYTEKKVRDMDGISIPLVSKEKDASRMVNTK